MTTETEATQAGRNPFTFEETQVLREEFKKNPLILNDMKTATRDLGLAQAALNGPRDDELTALKASPDDLELRSVFDEVYGVGAAEYYMEHRSVGDHLADGVAQIVGGAQEGIGAMADAAASSLDNTALGELLAITALDRAKSIAKEQGVPVTPEILEQAHATYAEGYRREVERWTDDRRDTRLRRILSDIRYLETDKFNRYSPDERENLLRQRKTEAEILAEPVAPPQDRAAARRDNNRDMGAYGMAGVLTSNPLTGTAFAGSTLDAVGEALRIDNPETMTGEIVGAISQFATAFAMPYGAATRLGLLTQAGPAAKIATGFIAGMFSDAYAFDPEDAQFIDFVEQVGGVDLSGTWLDYIRKDEDDTDSEKRLKAALEGAGIGAVVSVLLMGAARGARALRRGEPEEKVLEELSKTINEAPVEVQGNAMDPQALQRLEEQLQAEVSAWQVARNAEGDPTPEGVFGGQQQASPTTSAPEASPTGAPGPTPPRTAESSVEGSINGGPDDRLARIAERLNHPKRPTGVGVVQKIVKQVRTQVDDWLSTSLDDLQDLARETSRAMGKDGDRMFGEARTDAQLVKGAAPHVRHIMDLVRAGKLNDAVAYANDVAGDMGTITDKAFAYQSVASTLEKALEQARLKLDEVSQQRGAPPEIATTAEKLFDHILEAYLRMEAVNTNYGSWWGSMGRQRQSAQIAREATDAQMNPRAREVPEGTKAQSTTQVDDGKAFVKQAMESLQEKMKGEAFFWSWYQRLRKEGVKPKDAWGLIEDYIRTGKAEGVKADARLKPGTKEAGADTRSRAQKIVDAYVQYSYGSMLSGPDTHVVNNLTSFVKSLSAMLGEALYGTVGFDKTARHMVTDRVSGMVMGLGENLKHSWEAFKRSRTLLSEPVDEASNRSKFFAWGALRFMAASDQLFSGNWYRGELAAKAGREADLIGLKGAKRKAYIADQIKKGFDPEGRGVDLLAVHQSRGMTFQQQFNRQSPYAAERFYAKVTDIINHPNPVVRALMNAHVPFARIFFTLVDQGIRLTPAYHVPLQIMKKTLTGGRANLRFYDDLMGNNGKTAAYRAAGELSLGVGMTGAAMGLALQGKITGGHSSPWIMDPTTGDVAPPYSILIGNTWVPYGRYEPFAFTFKAMANIVEAHRRVADGRIRMDYETWQDEAAAVAASSAFVLGEVIASNPFMQTGQNVIDLLKMMTEADGDGRALERYFQGQYDKLIPNLARKFNDYQEGGDKYVGQTYWDRLLKSFTWLDERKWDLDVARNALTGEPLSQRTPGTALMPTDADTYGDPVATMLTDLYEATGLVLELDRPRGWTGLPPRTDLRQHKADDGRRSLYDLYLGTVSSVRLNSEGKVDPNGKTYREALTELANSPEFQEAHWGNRRFKDTDKVKVLRDLRTQYSAVGKDVVRSQKSYKALAAKQTRLEHLFSPGN